MSNGPGHRGVAWWCGWGGLLVMAAMGAAIGATDGGFSGVVGGMLMMAGLYALAVAVIALVRGRVSWAKLRSRGTALIGVVVAFVMLGAGGAVGGPSAEAGASGGAGPTSTSNASQGRTSSPDAPSATTSSPSASSTSSAAPESTSAAATLAAKKKQHVGARAAALAAVAGLTVKGRAAKTGYSREAFGQAWFDADRNGCDTRNDILRRDLTDRSMKNWCKVLAGTLTKDPYTGRSIRFVYGGASEIDIDHVVALGDAWQTGAAYWPFSKRLALANDPVNLLAVDAGANRAKGDGDAATWLPPNKAYRCKYVARQITVKKKYGLWVTPAERDAMVRVLSDCDNTELPPQGSAPTSARPPRTHTPAPTSTSVPKPHAPTAVAPAPVAPPPAPVYYANCTAVRAAGAAPIHVGDPGYSRKLDRDGDGVACE